MKTSFEGFAGKGLFGPDSLAQFLIRYTREKASFRRSPHKPFQLRGQSGKFVVGITHAAGNYGFTTNNFLVEGAQQISQMGSDAIFIYLTPSFSAIYPDQSANLWPPTQPTSLAQLAQTRSYDQVFHMPFKTIVITAYTFANTGTDWSQDGWNYVAGMAQSPARQQAEQNEFYQLTKYLYSKFSGSGNSTTRNTASRG